MIDDLLNDARSNLRRLAPTEVRSRIEEGALLVDTRTDSQRSEQGELPDAIVIDRTVLEWRLDPSSESRIPEIASYDQMIVVVCSQGYSSSLAAQSLQRLGFANATDVVGGVENWIRQGLPISNRPAGVHRLGDSTNGEDGI